MENYNTAVIRELITEAGQRAMAYFQKVTPSWKANRTYITDADLAVQAFLREELERRFPDDGLIGEERQLSKAPRHGDRYWVIDPIDGTASFVRGFPLWGIAVGLLTPEKALGGFFYLPKTGDFYYTRTDGSVWHNEQRSGLAPPDPGSREAVLMAGARFHRHYTIAPHYHGKVRSLGSTIAHICYAAVGSADAAFVERTAIWDLAAGLAMVLLNQGVAEYLDGTPVSLAGLLETRKSAQEMLIGHPEAVAYYRDVVRRAPHTR
jgi:fructose-1,6-bisphosphatase/inositol monophosphatase family enzyme